MSEDSYVGKRLSMKQEKLYKATSEIARLQRETYAIKVIGTPRIERVHALTEIVSGFAMPMREEK